MSENPTLISSYEEYLDQVSIVNLLKSKHKSVKEEDWQKVFYHIGELIKLNAIKIEDFNK